MSNAFSRAPGVLTLGGRSFVVLPPTPRDMLAVGERMRELARAKCVGPLEYVLQHSGKLSADALALAVREAIKLGAGGGGEPDRDAVLAQLATLEGARWRVWYHVSRVLKGFAPEEAAALVTEDNLMDALDALDAALDFRGIDPNAPAPATGSGS